MTLLADLAALGGAGLILSAVGFSGLAGLLLYALFKLPLFH